MINSMAQSNYKTSYKYKIYKLDYNKLPDLINITRLILA